jgi:hypothetical protein
VAAYDDDVPSPKTVLKLESKLETGWSSTLGHLMLVLIWCNQKPVMTRGSKMEDKKLIQFLANRF